MSVILVAEQDASYAERIIEILHSAGWDAKAVVSREAAFEAANAQRPALLIASASLPEASSLLAAFSRNRGGPGSVVLVPVAVAGRVSAADYQADALLDKPFSDDALTQIVRRWLYLESRPPHGYQQAGEHLPFPLENVEPPAKAATQQLTSQDIFGDVLAEVEAEAERSMANRRMRAMRLSDDVERKLEETLSGVFPLGDRPKRPSSAPHLPATDPTTPSAKTPRSRPDLSSDHEIDDLLDRTLSSLELPTRTRRTNPEETAPPTPQPVTLPPVEVPPVEVPPVADSKTVPPPLAERTHVEAAPSPQAPSAGGPSAPGFTPSTPAAPTAWEGFEPPPELFPVHFGATQSSLSSEPPPPVSQFFPSEPTPTHRVPATPTAPTQGAMAFDPEPGPTAFEATPFEATPFEATPFEATPFEATPREEIPPGLGDISASDLFPTSFDPDSAREFVPTSERLSERFDEPDDALSLGEEPLPDFFGSSLEDRSTLEARNPALARPEPDVPPEEFAGAPLIPTPAESFEAPWGEIDEPPLPAADSTLSNDLTFDLFPTSFSETSPKLSASSAADLGTDLPPELFPSSFGEEAPSPSWDTPAEIPPPPELVPPTAPPQSAAPPQAAGLETQRMPAMDAQFSLADLPPPTPTAESSTAKGIADKHGTDKHPDKHRADKHEPFTTHRMVALEDLATTPSTKEGEVFGDYTLIDRIAVGGMAEVWRARRRGVEGFQKTVAIKRILAHLTDTPDFINMFIDEAKLAAQLSHNHIIQIYDLGKVGGDFFIAMEFVDGKDLRSILDKARKLGKPLPLALALMIVAALARALDYAHRKKDFENRAMGLVHRDVSPQNVLISYEGEIKLCDFGIVKAVAKASTTQMGALKGKLQYMSPEQAWGKSVDGRSDIFSLGSVLFEVLTGERLFTGDSELNVLDAVRECRVRSPQDLVPDLPEEIDHIVRRALGGLPDERYQTAKELEQEINAALDALRLTPSQSALALYMGQLFNPPLEFHNYEAVDTPAAAIVSAKAPAALKGGEQALPVADTDTKGDGNRPRKWLLPVLLVVILAVLTALALFVMNRHDETQTLPAQESETPAEISTPGAVGPAVPNPGQGDGERGRGDAALSTTPEAAEAGSEDVGREEGATEQPELAGGGGETTADQASSSGDTQQEDSLAGGDATSLVDRLVEERLAETERELQRKYDAKLEAESQRLQRELEQTQRDLEKPPRPPPQEMDPNAPSTEESDGR